MRKGGKALLMLLSSVCTAALMMLWPVKPLTEVETAVVQRGDLVQSVLLNGMVRYAQEQPCISLKSGIVSDVYVRAGQTIQRGDLLFKLDTTVEEQALAALYEMRHAQQKAFAELDGAVSALALQNELEWRTSEAQLVASIEASQIRASADGIMEAVYVKAGDLVAETALLGMTHGKGRQIVSSAYAGSVSGISPGTAAIAKQGSNSVPAVLSQMGAADASGMQTLLFELMQEDAFDVGDTVQIELITSVQPSGALVPLAAIDADGLIWVVEDDKACSREIEPGECSRTHTRADESWTNQTVILYPEQYDLKDGQPVRVKK